MDQRARDVRRDIEHTRVALANKIETLDEQVRGKIEGVKHTVDLSYQVQQRPWSLLGASVVVGFMLERMLSGDSPASRADRRRPPSMPNPLYPMYVERKGEQVTLPAGVGLAAQTSTGKSDAVQKTNSLPKAQESQAKTSSAPPSKQEKNPGMLGDVLEQFKSELHTIKGIAVGAVTSLVHDMIKQTTPAASSFVKQAFNTAATKLTGQGIPEAQPEPPPSQPQEGQSKQHDPHTTQFATSAYTETRPSSLSERSS